MPCIAAALGALVISPRVAAQFDRAPLGELSSAVRIDEADAPARAHLERVEAFLGDGQWEEAIDTLRRVMDQHGDKLIAAAPQSAPEAAAGEARRDFQRYITLREYCQRRLCALAGKEQAALELYRNRVDGLAETWYREALELRDDKLLQRIATELLASSYGDRALFAWGEMALERGDYDTARHAWEQISPALRAPAMQAAAGDVPAGSPLWLAAGRLLRDDEWPALIEAIKKRERGEPPANDNLEHRPLAYPDTKLNVSEVRARLALVSILEGNRDRALVELALLKRLDPEVRGVLRGGETALVPALEKLLEESRHWRPIEPLDAWPTFARNPRRDGHAAPFREIELRPVWEVDLVPPIAADRAAERSFGFPDLRVGERYDEPLSYHPIVVDGVVFVAGPMPPPRDEDNRGHREAQEKSGSSRLQAFELATGKPAWGTENGVIYKTTLADVARERSQRQRIGVPRYTLSAHEQKLFARLGSPVTVAKPDAIELARDEPPTIVGFDLQDGVRMLPGFPLRPDDSSWSFEGPPLSDGTHLYVAMRRTDVRPQSHVACYDIATGALRWRREVCAAEGLGRGTAEEISHQLLTLDGERIYFNTNAGVVAALAKHDGRILWAVQYPRAGVDRPGGIDRPWHVFRDLNPAVLHRGMVLVAPADSDRLFALEAATGRLAWETHLPSGVMDAVHLLGAWEDTLVAAGRRLWWIDVYTGRLSRRFAANPFPQPRQASPEGHGRGLIAGNFLYWPARGDGEDILYVFDMASGRLARQPIPLHLGGGAIGNLVAAEGYLIVAASRKLIVFATDGAKESD